jgi:SAM-dependent methyltransferase
MSATDSLPQSGARYVPESAGTCRRTSRHRYLLARELAESKTVLNIACGDGSGADLLASVARSVIGIESDPDHILRLSQRYRRPTLSFRAGSCIAIPAMDGSIDLVVSFETIEREPHHARMIGEIRRILAPGGVLVLSIAAPQAGARGGVELERLLHAHFAYVSVVGQRMYDGSIVGPLNDQGYTQFVTCRDDQVEAIAGLEAPDHLIAFASDAPLPAVPIGVMDGDDNAASIAEEPLSAPVTEPIDARVEALLERVAHLSRVHLRELARLEEFRQAIVKMEATTDRHRAEAMEAWDQVRAREARISALEQRHASDLEGERAAHQQRLAEVEHEVSHRSVIVEGLAARVRILEADRASMQSAIAVMEGSRSWQLTRPLRDVRRLLSRMAKHR